MTARSAADALVTAANERAARIAAVRAADTALPSRLVTVLPEYGGDGVAMHLPVRTAGLPFSGPTVYLTACGRYAHGTVRGESVATCVPCAQSEVGRLIRSAGH